MPRKFLRALCPLGMVLHAAVGRWWESRTGCKLVYVDTSMNPVRGTPLGSSTVSYDPGLRTNLAAAYDAMAEPRCRWFGS